MIERVRRSYLRSGFVIQEVSLEPRPENMKRLIGHTQVRITYMGAGPDQFVLAHNVDLAKHMIDSGEALNCLARKAALEDATI